MNLKAEIHKGESPTLEFKRDIPDQSIKYLKTVSAFANCFGGKLVFSVDADSSIYGMDERAWLGGSGIHGLGQCRKGDGAEDSEKT